MTTRNETPTESSRRRRWLPHAAWGTATALAFLLGIGAGASGADTADTSAEPTPTVTVTAEPEVVEADPSEETLAEIAEREDGLDTRVEELDDREAELTERAADLDEREASIGEAELEVEEGAIPGNGIFLVGEDVEPGTYRGDGSSGTCYWARLSGTSGDLDDIIANGLPEGPTVVTIAESDVAFETNGCAEWTKE